MVMKAWTRRHCIKATCVLGLAAGMAWAAPAHAAEPPVLLVVGDSLSAEYGLPRGSGWVTLLEQRLAERKIAAKVVNASISGDTTAGGRSRLPALLTQHKPAIVVIELGGNDALRGLPLKSTQDNLSTMAKASREAGARVLLVGMQLPPNYGGQYGRQFQALFSNVAKAEKTALAPFLLAGFSEGEDAMSWFQPDRIHPNARAQPKMLDNVWPALQPLLTK